MACFRCVLWGRGGWLAEGEDHSRTKPLAGHQPCGFWPRPTSLARVCSAQPPWRRRRSDIVGCSTGTRGCCPHTRGDVSAWSCFLSFVLLFPLPPRPDVLDLLVDFSSSFANDIIGISIVFLMFLLPRAFGDLRITPGLPPLPLSITAVALGFWESSPWLPPPCTGQLGITCFSCLLFLFPAQSQLSVRDAAFPAEVCLFYLAVNSLFCFTHGNWGHGNHLFSAFRYH